jgi:hypothetical protein
MGWNETWIESKMKVFRRGRRRRRRRRRSNMDKCHD